MSWGPADHTHHDYAATQHSHSRFDISDVAEEYHHHRDLEDRISVASSDCRDSRMELLERIRMLERTVRGLRRALDTLIAEGPETAAEVLERLDVEANQ